MATLPSVQDLDQLSRPELMALWERVQRRKLPRALRCGLLKPSLAYHLQERQHGGLSSKTRARIRQLAVRMARGTSMAGPPTPRLSPGTRLIRDWNGEHHEVTVMDTGYAYRGQPFQSLSAIARRITGARWSGPKFFGLTGAPTVAEPPHG